MRKLLFTLLFCGVTLVGYSQTNISTSIDSLQNEYNFLKCEFKLYQVSNNLSGLDKDISIKCNYIDIKRYHKMFYKPLSDALEDNYNSCIYLKSSIEDNYQSLERAEKATHLLAISKGIVIAVYIPTAWRVVRERDNRIECDAVEDLHSEYIGKCVDSYYGFSANPVKYINY